MVHDKVLTKIIFPSAKYILDWSLITLFISYSFEIDEDDPVCCEDINLQVQNSGHILHAFVNGKHIGNSCLFMPVILLIFSCQK